MSRSTTDAFPMLGDSRIPVIDVSPLIKGSDPRSVAARIDAACRVHGFFTITGHGVDSALRSQLDSAARSFFALSTAEKSLISMDKAGSAWRGWFGVGDELTSGMPDKKEGVYFGADLPDSDRRVRDGWLLHGPNLWPERPVELRPVVTQWMSVMTELSAAIMQGIALGLGLAEDHFSLGLTVDPTILFRMFRYPPTTDQGGWGVGEHIDYGLLTILAQDMKGGLQVRTTDGWVDVPPDPDAFVCNIGDMLDRMTAGRYRSTPHRVVAPTGTDRLSFPFFYDPGWTQTVEPLPVVGDDPPPEALDRWDGTSLSELGGTYGEYLTSKVSKVFPALRTSANQARPS